MLIRHLEDCEKIIAGDRTILREPLHPDKMDVAIRYSLAHAVVKPGDASQSHALKTSEVYYILAGEGEMHIGEETANVHAGHTVYIPPNATQYIRNTGTDDLAFLCIVDPAWRFEDETVHA